MKKRNVSRRAPLIAAILVSVGTAFGGFSVAALTKADRSSAGASPAAEAITAQCAHQYVYPVVTKRPTASATGSAVFTCALNSAHKVSVTLPKLGSGYVKVSDSVYIFKSAYGDIRVELTADAPVTDKTANVGLIVGLSVSGAFVLMLSFGIVFYVMRKKRKLICADGAGSETARVEEGASDQDAQDLR